MIPPLLTSQIQAPIPENQFSVPYFVGGDDTHGWDAGLIAQVAKWDLNENRSTLTANLLFVVKKLFNFLDAIGIGESLYGHFYGLRDTPDAFIGFDGKLRQYKHFQSGALRNQQAREKIVTALGGVEACRTFRVVILTHEEYQRCWRSGNFDVRDEHFMRGESIVQGETPAGTKYAAMRLIERATGRIFNATIHQCYRESHISLGGSDGSSWFVSFFPFLPHSQITNIAAFNADVSANLIQAIRNGSHREYALAPKS